MAMRRTATILCEPARSNYARICASPLHANSHSPRFIRQIEMYYEGGALADVRDGTAPKRIRHAHPAPAEPEKPNVLLRSCTDWATRRNSPPCLLHLRHYHSDFGNIDDRDLIGKHSALKGFAKRLHRRPASHGPVSISRAVRLDGRMPPAPTVAGRIQRWHGACRTSFQLTPILICGAMRSRFRTRSKSRARISRIALWVARTDGGTSRADSLRRATHPAN